MPNADTQNDPRWGSQDRPLKAEAIWRTLLHYCGAEIKNGLWLDIGCGSGGIAAALAPRVRAMIGLDPEPWVRWQPFAAEHDNLRFVVGCYDPPPEDIVSESVDVVVCNQVYEHVPDPAALVAYIHQVLKPGGCCYFAGPNLLWLIEPHVHWPFVHWLPQGVAIWIMRAAGARNLIDAKAVNYWTLLRKFQGFEVNNALPFAVQSVAADGWRRFLWSILANIPACLLEWLTPLSPGFVFILKKPARTRA